MAKSELIAERGGRELRRIGEAHGLSTEVLNEFGG